MTSISDHDLIRVRGARVNNLKDISVEIPKRQLTVFTGVSGSGKSSLVFDTIAAESQRLINETYSAFVQGFMPTLARPDVDVLDGLTTAIIVDQERIGANSRSTVGTITDANAMLRIVFSRLGKPRIGSPNAYSFNVPSVKASGGMTVERGPGKTKTEKVTFTRLGGMCPRCEGMGSVTDFDTAALYDDTLSLNDGALTIPGYSMEGWYGRIFRGCGFFDPDKPIRKYNRKELHDLLYKEPTKIKVVGINLTYEGLIPKIQKSFLSKDVDALQPHVRAFVERAVTFRTCPECDGTRLSKEARSSKVKGKNIADVCSMQISDLADWVRRVDEPSVAPLVTGLQHLLDAFAEIGLGYLSLDRPTGTLSGGEAQRTKMIRHLGSSLTDVTYVFDEPTVGLHPHDIARMNDLLLRLRDKGNTVLVVEHKPQTIAIADHVIDLGPGAGTAGGEVMFEGTVDGLRASRTITGRHLDDRASLKPSVRTPSGVLEVRGASLHNLQDVDVNIPLGVLVVVTGVAGSGKSSLIQGSVSGREGVVSVDQGAIRGSRRSNPATVHRTARPDPQCVREGQQREAGAVQRQLRRRLSHLQWRRRHLHRPGDDGRRRHHLRGMRGETVSGGGPEVQVRWPEHQRGARDVSDRGRAILRRRQGAHARRARHPRAARRRRARLRQSRPAADDVVRWRAAAAQAGHSHGREGRRLRPRRADHGPSPRRRRTTARPARPARRLRQVGDRHRASPGSHGARRLDHRPWPRRRPRRRPDRLRGHTRRPRRRRPTLTGEHLATYVGD